MKIKILKEQQDEKTITQRNRPRPKAKNVERHANGMPKEWPDDWDIDPNNFADFADEPLPGGDVGDDDDEKETSSSKEEQLRNIIKQEIEGVLSNPQIIKRLAAIIKRS